MARRRRPDPIRQPQLQGGSEAHWDRSRADLPSLESVLRESWGPDTVDPDDGWSTDNPARGHCDVTALVVQDLLGGELLAADVYLHDERVGGHMWNRLPSGIEIDLTREQFTRGETIRKPRARPRLDHWDPGHPRFHRYEAYLILAARVRAKLPTTVDVP